VRFYATLQRDAGGVQEPARQYGAEVPLYSAPPHAAVASAAAVMNSRCFMMYGSLEDLLRNAAFAAF